LELIYGSVFFDKESSSITQHGGFKGKVVLYRKTTLNVKKNKEQVPEPPKDKWCPAVFNT
jgi:hypothetical protein